MTSPTKTYLRAIAEFGSVHAKSVLALGAFEPDERTIKGRNIPQHFAFGSRAPSKGAKPTMDTVTDTGGLVSGDKVKGARIYSATGDSIGSIDDIMIDEKSGSVAYAVMSSGGFFGMGTRYHPLPWSMLRHDANLGGYVVNVDRAQLELAPACGRWY